MSQMELGTDDVVHALSQKHSSLTCAGLCSAPHPLLPQKRHFCLLPESINEESMGTYCCPRLLSKIYTRVLHHRLLVFYLDSETQYRNDPKPIERTCSRNMLALIHGVLIYRVQISTILVRACLPVQPLRCRCLKNLWRLGHEVYFRILQRSSQAHPCAQKPRPFPP